MVSSIKNDNISIDGTLTSPGQSIPGSIDNEEVFHIPQNSKTEVSPSNDLVPQDRHSLEG